MECLKCGGPLTGTRAICDKCFNARSSERAEAQLEESLPDMRGTAAAAAESDGGYAGFWLRVVAYTIDTSLLGIIGTLLTLLGFSIVEWLSGALAPLLAKGGAAMAMLAVGLSLAVAYLLLWTLLGWAYFVLFESSPLQATPGKLIVGLYVTDLQGERISVGRSTVRNLGRFLFVVPLLLALAFALLGRGSSSGMFAGAAMSLMMVAAVTPLLTYAMAAFTERKQGLHDLLSGALVLCGSAVGAPRIIGSVIAAILIAVASHQFQKMAAPAFEQGIGHSMGMQAPRGIP